MKLKNLYKSYKDMTHEERLLFINNLRVKRQLPLEIKKSKKAKSLLSEDEERILAKVLSLIK